MARVRKEEPAFDIAVPIVPMLDMSFQLLAFFILTFRVMPMEGQLSINLPKIEASDTPQNPDPTMEDKKDEYTIFLNASSDGGVANIGLKGPTGGSPDIKNLADLEAQLRQITPPAGKKREEGIAITIESDPDLTYAKLIEIMNLCKPRDTTRST